MNLLANPIRQILLVIRSWFFTFIPKQEYLYMACGGINLVWDTLIFFISYHYIFHANNFTTPFFTFSPHIAAFFVSFCFSFPTGFFMSRYVVWVNSPVRARHQLFRYLSVVFLCIILNIGLLKLFVEEFHFYPLPSRLLAAVFVITVSYLFQRFYTFKVHKLVDKG